MNKKLQHNLPDEFTLEKVMESEVGVFYFYGNIIVFEAYEGVVVSYKTGFSILLKFLSILGTKPFVYISNRVNSYSINPVDYKYVNNIPTLKSLGIVYYNEMGKANAELEEKFCKKPFQIFNNLTEAFIWAKNNL